MGVHLSDHTGQAVAGVNACLLEHSYRTCEWKLGETIITGIVVGSFASVRLGVYSSDLGIYSLFEFVRIPTVDAANLVSGNPILWGLVMRRRAVVEPPA